MFEKPVRQWLPPQFRIEGWSSVAPYVETLITAEWRSFSDFHSWLQRLNEVEAVISEEAAWNFIRFTQNTQDEASKLAYERYITEVQPRLSEARYQLYKRYWESPWRSLLPEEEFLNFNRTVQNFLSLYNPENIALETKAELLAKEYNEIVGGMTIEVDGQVFTLPQASLFLESQDRKRRKEVWEKIQAVRAAHQARLDEILSELVAIRTQIAQNAGFDNYYDYRFRQLGRFDWTVDLCHEFHRVVEKVVRRLYRRLLLYRRHRLGLETLYPWDLQVDVCDGTSALRPFQTESELIEKSIELFDRLHPKIGAQMRYLQEIGHLDLFSRPGKAPGGYNYTLQESGLPFIFMNAAGSHSDLVTLIHEAGHAVHTFQSRHIPYVLLRDYPSEVAELASMGLELIAMYHLEVFYPSLRERGRAWFQQVSRIITILPWIATVDAFQEWLYKNPHHTPEERRAAWVKIYRRFHGEDVAWPEGTLEILWQRQLHIFDYPLYYIEYGIAQIGALQLWYHYDRHPRETLERYLYALSLGYTRRVPEIYEAAGVRFWFDMPLLEELFRFIITKLKKVRTWITSDAMV